MAASALCEQAEQLKEQGNAEYQRGNYAAALPYYDRAIAAQTSSGMAEEPALYLNRAAAYMMTREFSKAFEDASTALHLDPDHRTGKLRMSRILLRLGQLELAFRYAGGDISDMSFTSSASAGPQDLRNELVAGRQLWEAVRKQDPATVADLGSFQASLDRLLELSPCSVVALEKRCLVLIRLYELDQARQWVRSFVELHSTEDLSALAAKCNGLIAYAEGDFQQAHQFLADHVRLVGGVADQDGSADVLSMMKRSARMEQLKHDGNTHFKAGDFRAAAVAYQECLQVDAQAGSHPVVLSNLSAAWMRAGDVHQALAAADKAVASNSYYKKGHARRGMALMELGKFEEAKAAYERAGQSENAAAADCELRKSRGETAALPSGVVHIHSDDEFHKLAASGQFPGVKIAVKFGATWCGPCRQIAPHYEALASRLVGRGVFLDVDVDDCQTTASQFRISAVPTILVMQDGRVLETLRGGDLGRLQQILSA